jgi:hypothetical protein
MGIKRLNKLGALATTAAATTCFLIASPAQAGKPSGGGGTKPPRGTTSSIQLVVLTGGDSVPNWGEDVTFNVSTTATTEPHVDLTCSQGGAVVYSATTGFYASYPWPWTQTMNLASQSWTGGDASCSARLYMFSGKGTSTLASLSFTAFA